MDLLHQLMMGLGAGLVPGALGCALGGALLGMALGTLSGISIAASMAMLLPIAAALSPVSAVLLLAGMLCGAPYGRWLAARSLHRMAGTPLRPAVGAAGGLPAGPGGRALLLAGLGTLLAVAAGALGLLASAPVVAALAQALGPAEVCALMVLGLMCALLVAAGSRIKAIAMVLLGLLLGLVGGGPQGSTLRFAGDLPMLQSGISLMTLAIGVLGVGDVIHHLGSPATPSAAPPGFLPKAAAWAAVPLLPLLALGLPVTAPMALLAASMAEHALLPGAPLLYAHPEIFWALVVALGLGNLLCLLLTSLLCLPWPGGWRAVPRLPPNGLIPALLLVAVLGLYTRDQGALALAQAAGLGLLGYGLRKLDMAAAPMLLAFVLAHRMEEQLGLALQASGGDWGVFVTRPWAAGLLAAALVLLVFPRTRLRRAKVFAHA